MKLLIIEDETSLQELMTLTLKKEGSLVAQMVKNLPARQETWV